MAKIIKVSDDCFNCPYYKYNLRIVEDIWLRHFCKKSMIGSYDEKILLEHCLLEEEKADEVFVKMLEPVDSPNNYPITTNERIKIKDGDDGKPLLEIGNSLWRKIDDVDCFSQKLIADMEKSDRYCEKCGTPNNKEYKYCHECGYKMRNISSEKKTDDDKDGLTQIIQNSIILECIKLVVSFFIPASILVLIGSVCNNLNIEWVIVTAIVSLYLGSLIYVIIFGRAWDNL